jgi:hypothetical protein
MDNTTKALALAKLGIKVFPVDRKTKSPLITRGGGFYDAVSDDYEKIATWFSLDYPESTTAVGVWTGGSGLFVLDVDRGKKNGKDGFKSIKASGHPVGKTASYKTQSGGEHRIWQTERTDLIPAQDFGGLSGVDIRAGGSYVVWWGDAPESRDVFSNEIPDWLLASAEASTFTGAGYSGGVSSWLDSLPDDVLPSGRVADFIARIPSAEFGHPEMVDRVWGLVRMGSERETGIKTALDALRSAWLRGQYDTPDYRRDFDMALKGAIVKAGRVQNPVPSVRALSSALSKANEAGVADDLKAMERKVSETGTEIDFARARKEMFAVCALAGLSASNALGIVAGSKAFKNSKVGLESMWFGDGEPEYHDVVDMLEQEPEAVAQEPDALAETKALVASLAHEADKFTFLSEAEQAVVDGADHRWWGTEYLEWVQTRLKHFNKPYHVTAMWTALSVIASPWGKMPLRGFKPTDTNLYSCVLGESSSGKSEAWGFGSAMVDAFYGTERSPIIGDTKKTSAISLHRTLVLKDGEPTLVMSDEVQGFFQDLQTSHWQGSILADMSDYYGGNVPPKNTMNDKEISGKRAKSLLTAYFTGIADMSLDAISIDNWRSGFFYRFLWSFGYPRETGDFEVTQEVTPSSYSEKPEEWAREFKRIQAFQETKWGAGRIVMWDDDALSRVSTFNKQLDDVTKSSALYDTVFIPANGRFLVSVMKCATLIALTEASATVTMRHTLIALSYAGPWHRSMVLAVSETGKEKFDREAEKCLTWVRRNAIKQVGKKPVIQRSAVMRAFRPNEVADRLLRQLTEEGWLARSGDVYEISE